MSNNGRVFKIELKGLDEDSYTEDWIGKFFVSRQSWIPGINIRGIDSLGDFAKSNGMTCETCRFNNVHFNGVPHLIICTAPQHLRPRSCTDWEAKDDEKDA